MDGTNVLLNQARNLGRYVAPFLDKRLPNFPRVSSELSAHLLWHIHTLLSWRQFGHQLGYISAKSLRLQRTSFCRIVLEPSLSVVVTFLRSLQRNN